MFRYFYRENGPGLGAAHDYIEQYLHSSGLDHVVLHSAYYFQSFLYFMHVSKTAGIFPHLLGDMKPNMVNCCDVIQFAAALLTRNDETLASFNGRHVEIAGPENLRGEDCAEALRREGVDVQFKKVSPEAFKQGFLSAGVSADIAINITAIHTCFYDGSAQIADHATTPNLMSLPGSPASLRLFVHELFQDRGMNLRQICFSPDPGLVSCWTVLF